jgi:hypothetical protein
MISDSVYVSQIGVAWDGGTSASAIMTWMTVADDVVDLEERGWRSAVVVLSKEFAMYGPRTSTYICSYWEFRPGMEMNVFVRVESSCMG